MCETRPVHCPPASNFKRCAAADPKFNECLRGAVEDAFHKMIPGKPPPPLRAYREYLKTVAISRPSQNAVRAFLCPGVPSLGVLPIDPLKVEQIKINQGGGSVSMNMDLRNMRITGLADTKMLNYRSAPSRVSSCSWERQSLSRICPP